MQFVTQLIMTNRTTSVIKRKVQKKARSWMAAGSGCFLVEDYALTVVSAPRSAASFSVV